ncbi:alkaline phosphatase D [Sphaerisporangium siamense]|uniref:Alkaline phosphatase D n=1 Tax=Sphaerisporangium siamense TaxID=795645 RepID=A0A7W7GEU7_9ACTN|nr:alkaline phosphatase D family protein [Sphaerisporangium siamense]MBB4704426.1 alkaline phosphatase D [Sphaerisporangium siamense]GII84890.1 alkaline phosphatase D [Sphaerisporangium siamense]
MEQKPSRRVFLIATAAGAGGLLVPGSAAASGPPPAGSRAASTRAGRLAPDPFTLGIASGDPAPDGFVLWTRLAPDPLAPDGRGGMPSRDADVAWQVAADEGFRQVVRAGTATARPGSAHAVHVEVHGLAPGREYFYRFRAGGHVSETGRTRTAPAASTATGAFTFAAVSCAQYEHGFYTAYRRMAEQHPDLVVHLGDYIYEYSGGVYTAAQGNVRRHVGGKLQTLADYRLRHAQYKTDPDLQLAHRTSPWLVIFDDHEVENNWAADVPGTQAPAFEARKAAGFQAYYENMPLRASAVARGRHVKINRRVDWGALATFHLLDTRQFRDDQPCGDGMRSGCDERLGQERVMLGEDQMTWLAAGLGASPATWNLVAQQVVVGQRDYRLGPGRELNVDAWDGYPADRDRLLRALSSSNAGNPVVLTGDAHVASASDLTADFDDPDARRVGVELVSTSISSDGDGYHDPARDAALLAENPALRFVNERRGYIMCTAGPDALTADFRTLDHISRKGAPARTAATFTVPAGERTLT